MSIESVINKLNDIDLGISSSLGVFEVVKEAVWHLEESRRLKAHVGELVTVTMSNEKYKQYVQFEDELINSKPQADAAKQTKPTKDTIKETEQSTAANKS